MSLIGNLLRGMVARADGFMSAITGINDRTRDKNTTFTAFADAPFDVDTLAAIYHGGDIAEKIANALPEKALKQGFGLSTADGDMDPSEMQAQAKELLKAADAIGLRDKVFEADTWGRVYGIGGIVLGVSGSGPPEEPLDDERATSLDWIMVVDRREVIPASYYTDPASTKFGEVEFYRINPVTAMGMPMGKRGVSLTFAATQNQDPANIAVLGLLIHETRFVRFGGILTSRRDRQTNEGCDHSVYQRLYKTLQQTEANWDAVCQLMTDMSQGVFSIEGLINLIAAGNEAALLTRMQALDMGRSTARAIVLDAKNEKFERVQTPMAGVDEVIMRTWQRLASAAKMPLTVLFGVSPAGLNATGESDVRLWYDDVQAHREHVLAPRLLRILRLLSKTLGHKAPESWQINWPSLWQMTAVEQADYRLKTVQADDIEIKNGTILPEEAALTRYGNGDEFNGGKVQISIDERKVALEAALEDIVNPPEPVAAPPPGKGAPPPPGGPTPPAPGEAPVARAA